MVKRIIVTCDGTWVNSDNGFVRDSFMPWNHNGHLATASNVTRICRAILPRSKDNVPQITYYQGGLGSQDNIWSFMFGGFLGEGISENIREAYAFICNNYEAGDEISLIGFSRGAFTARSIGGLISSIGLLTKKGLSSFYPIFRDWENQNIKGYVNQYETVDWPKDRPRFRDPQYLSLLRQKEMTRFGEKGEGIPIEAVGVWDTVGSLGVPDVKVLGLNVLKDSRTEYAFINTQVAPNVKHAYQALALDEQRTPFVPTVWEMPKPESGAILKKLKQSWFPGVHTSIGGGHQDASVSDLTLAWMITQLSEHIAFDPSYIPAQRAKNETYYETKSLQVRPWGTGLIPASNVGLVPSLTGYSPRTPGTYHATDPDTGLPLKRRLVETHEFIHPSVRYRIDTKGPGLSTKSTDLVGQGTYQPAALKGWTYCPPNMPWGREELGFGADAAQWDQHGKWIRQPDPKTGEPAVYIVEEKIDLASPQGVLLNSWPGVKQVLGGYS